MRENGYYWAYVESEGPDPHVLLWQDDRWFLAGWEVPIPDGEVRLLSDDRLTPPASGH